MPRLLPETVALRTLRGEQVPARCAITREQAIDLLKSVTRQDFGDDADKWAASLRLQPKGRGGSSEDGIGTVTVIHASGEVQIELDDGSLITAIVPATIRRRLFTLRPGMRLLVRHREAGCSQVLGLATP